MDLPINPREVLSYLNELGYKNISKEQLKDFLLDLKKLIKYQLRSESEDNKSDQNSFESIPSVDISPDVIPHHHLPTESTLAKQIGRKVHLRIERQGKPCSCPNLKLCVNKVSYPSLLSHRTSCTTIVPTTLADVQDVPRIPVTSKLDGIYNKKYTSVKLKHSAYILPRPPKKMLKCDPVELYHKYKEEWKKLNFPGEASHSELRWAIRERLIGQPQFVNSSTECFCRRQILSNSSCN